MGALIQKIRSVFPFVNVQQPDHLRKGKQGEKVAERHLCQRRLKLLARNYSSGRGEIDLIFRQDQCMVFVEVKTRSEGQWYRPAAAVNARKRNLICQAAMDYLKQLNFPKCQVRFDIVEVLLNDDELISEVRHLPNAFSMPEPYRY